MATPDFDRIDYSHEWWHERVAPGECFCCDDEFERLLLEHLSRPVEDPDRPWNGWTCGYEPPAVMPDR